MVSRIAQDAAAELFVRANDLTQFAANIGVQPDSFRRRGEWASVGRRRLMRDIWTIEERMDNVPADDDYGDAVLLCLDRLLHRIVEYDLTAKLHHLQLEEPPVISVHGHCFEIPCLYYQAKAIRAMADLGADLWEDFYLISGTDEHDGNADGQNG